MDNIELVGAELERIRNENDGVLMPAAVVDIARNPDNILHSRFTWDDTEAAEKYRIWQARRLISLVVTILQNETKPIRAYVSLRDDREDEGGYRGIVDVLKDDDLRGKLIKDAFAEFRHFRDKYNHLKALEPVFQAMEKVEQAVLELQEA